MILNKPKTTQIIMRQFIVAILSLASIMLATNAIASCDDSSCRLNKGDIESDNYISAKANTTFKIYYRGLLLPAKQTPSGTVYGLPATIACSINWDDGQISFATGGHISENGLDDSGYYLYDISSFSPTAPPVYVGQNLQAEALLFTLTAQQKETIANHNDPFFTITFGDNFGKGNHLYIKCTPSEN